jgi:hypothetical protein
MIGDVVDIDRDVANVLGRSKAVARGLMHCASCVKILSWIRNIFGLRVLSGSAGPCGEKPRLSRAIRIAAIAQNC